MASPVETGLQDGEASAKNGTFPFTAVRLHATFVPFLINELLVMLTRREARREACKEGKDDLRLAGFKEFLS